MNADPRIASHGFIRHAAVHESSHSISRTLLPSLGGVQYVALTLDETDGALLGNVRLNPELPNEKVFENVVAKLCGYAAEVLLLNRDSEQAHIAAADDFAKVEELIARFEEDDRQYFRVRGMRAAFDFVQEHREKILKLADELIAATKVSGDRVREIANGAA